MATAALTKTILITLPAASVSSVQCQNGTILSPKIGTKRTYSIVSTPSVALSSSNSALISHQKSPSPPALAMSSGATWLPATVQRNYKYETIDDDYDYAGDSEDQQSQYTDADGDGDQPPRKRERLTHLTPEEKMFRRKMKNRIAAQTARDRKKALMIDLEETVRRLEEENDTLHVQNSKLLQESSSLAEENERLKKMLAEQQQQQAVSYGQDEARTVSAFGPAEGASEGRMGVDLARSIRADPAVLEILRQIVATGGATKNVVAVGAAKGEQQLNIGGCAQSQSTGGYREIAIDNSILQNVKYEAALTTESVTPSLSATNDHQYFSNVMSSSPVLFSSSAGLAANNFDFETVSQPEPSTNLFSNNDTVDHDVEEYFQLPISPLAIDSSIVSSNINSSKSPNGVVPTSPIMNSDMDFPPLGDDLLQQALQSLGDLTKFAESATNGTSALIGNQNQNGQIVESGFEFLQNDDYTDLVWEESFAQLFPSLS